MKSLLLSVVAIAAIATAAHADTVNVNIKNYMFTPMNVTITQGSTVKWTNQDDIPHTVVEKTKTFRSAALDTGDSYTRTFDQPGTYEYFCGLHPQMVAKVIVKAAAKHK